MANPYIVYLLENYGLEDYAGKRRQIREIFQKYREREENDPYRSWSERLIKKHAEYCQRYGNEISIRRHNSFVLKYVGGHSDRAIAKKQSIVPRTVEKDVVSVLNDLLVLVYGIDGLRQKPDEMELSDAPSEACCMR